MTPDRRTQDHNERLGSAMRNLGFEHKKLRFDGESKWGYARGTAEERERRVYCYYNGFGSDPYCSYASPNDAAAAEMEKVAREAAEKERASGSR
jgi:hypothetical protein